MFHYTQEVIRNNLCRDKSIPIFLCYKLALNTRLSTLNG